MLLDFAISFPDKYIFSQRVGVFKLNKDKFEVSRNLNLTNSKAFEYDKQFQDFRNSKIFYRKYFSSFTRTNSLFALNFIIEGGFARAYTEINLGGENMFAAPWELLGGGAKFER